LESKGTRKGWLEKVIRAGQDAQWVLVPIIIIIIIIIKGKVVPVLNQLSTTP
jgi:hypothetical protein